MLCRIGVGEAARAGGGFGREKPLRWREITEVGRFQGVRAALGASFG